MKEIILKIELMAPERLKSFEDGRWSKAYLVSAQGSKARFEVSPAHQMGKILNVIKKDQKDI